MVLLEARLVKKKLGLGLWEPNTQEKQREGHKVKDVAMKPAFLNGEVQLTLRGPVHIKIKIFHKSA